MKLRKAITLALIITLSACKKNETIVQEKTTAITPTEIKVGNTAGMQITPYNQNIYGEIDLNNDGENDLKIDISNFHSPGLGVHFINNLKPLHNKLELLVYQTTDTLFLNTTQSIFTNSNGTIGVNIYKLQRCYRSSVDDSISGILPNVKYITPLINQELLTTAALFSNSELSLTTDGYTDTYTTYSANMDTVYTTQKTRVYGCKNFPANNVYFIGFKYTYSNKVKLGWLKVVWIYPNTLTLLETAIQN